MHSPSPATTTGVLGIDIGGTKVALRIEPLPTGAAPPSGAAADRAGAVGTAPAPVEATFRWDPAASAARDLDELARQVASARSRWAGPISAVGLAMPATVDQAGTVTTWPGRPSWTGLALAGALRELVPGAAVTHADDGDLAALAEAAAAGCPDLVYLGIGTGVGGGIVLDGRNCPRPGRGSAEIGHMVISVDGAPCTCGRRGCVQAVASGPATLRRAARHRRAAADPAAHTDPAAGTGAADVSFPELRAAWLASTGWAVQAVRESAAAAAVAVVSLTELLHPALAVIGGGFADGLPGFAAAVDEQARGLGRAGHPPAPVRAAVLGGLSSLSGAVLLARQHG